MNRLAVFACASLSAAMLTPTVLADEASLGEWARARWEAYVVEGPQALSAALHAEGGTVFMGTPWDGFYYGDDSEQAWSELQEQLQLEAVQVEAERVLPAGNLVWGVLSIEGTEPDSEETRVLTLASALA